MKKAFTLAEVLIVITIVGVIATLVSTVTIVNMPARNPVLLKKTYVAFNKAIYEVANNEFYYPISNEELPVLSQPQKDLDATGWDPANPADTYRTRLATLWSVNNPGDINANNYFCYAIASMFTTEGNVNCACPTPTPTLNYNFTTTDGTAIYGLCGQFHPVQGSGQAEWHPIYMYINAEEHSPNDFSTLNIANAYITKIVPAPPRIPDTKTNIYRFYVNAKAQIIINDEPEKTLTSRAYNNK